jgi:hypothetical protein
MMLLGLAVLHRGSAPRLAAGALAFACANCACGSDATVLIGAPSGGVAATPNEVTTALEPDVSPSPEVDAGLARGDCGLIGEPRYDFSSRFVPGVSSVAYGGPSARHVLLAELRQFIQGLSARLDDGERYEQGELVAALDVYLENPGGRLNGAPLELTLPGSPELTEQAHAELARGVSLIERLAGNGPGTVHRKWNDPGVFSGWEDRSVGRIEQESFTPEGLLVAWCEELEINAQSRQIGFFQRDPSLVLLPVSVTRNGRDMAALISSFLLGAVAFSQAVAGELVSDVPGVGLLSSLARDGDLAYSPLEHAWDEAFGYFGAARDYDQYTAEEAAAVGGEGRANGWHDTNADCRVSLASEVNFGAAVYAAARDQGSVVPTNLRGEIFDAFVAGRRLLARADGTLSGAEQAELMAYRDRAVASWEQALAATAVHGINALIKDLELALRSSADYAFLTHARHWSELKGLALGFQFNPTSALSAEAFASLHELIGDVPAVPDTLPPSNVSELERYADELLRARDLLEQAYGFAAENVRGW